MAHDAIEAHCCFDKSTGNNFEQDTTVNDNSTAFQREVLCQLLTRILHTLGKDFDWVNISCKCAVVNHCLLLRIASVNSWQYVYVSYK